ncbi:MarR family winged helix-turn-helix transcriptional regulator [Nitrospina sp. 32_T5]|uniref:MarR family winged helix-turn-helix transcriptional regulator n=1 Tax=unclassified Nitrospina TaxID=2638683 RepID=UPI003F9E5845
MAAKYLTQLEETAWTGLIKGHQVAMDRVESALKRQGFPPLVWYDVLLELSRVTGGRLRLTEIGEATLLKKFNVTRLIDRMAAEGLVRREACVEDARGAYAAITAKGRKLQQRMRPVYHAAVRRHFMECFRKEEVSVLADLFQRLLKQPGEQNGPARESEPT